MRPLAAALCLAPLLAAPLAAAAAAADAASLPPPPLRIAIIGAGPGGTSAAYWLARAQQQLDAAALLSAESQAAGGGQRTAVPLRDAFDVTVYEREERIGGRTAIVHPHDDDSLEAIELGASIFADVNYNLKRAAKQFGLPTDAKLGEDDATVGIWDGQQFLVEGLDDSWWNSARMLWRYGYSPMTTKKLVTKLVSLFVSMYDAKFLHAPRDEHANATASGFPWATMEELSKAVGFKDLSNQVAGDYFAKQGVTKLFTDEVIEAATLVNYGQDIYSIHAVGGGVSLAASGATGIRGGNYKLFEEFLGRSGARLRMGLGGQVTGLVKFASASAALEAGHVQASDVSQMRDEGVKWWVGTRSGAGALYDRVLVATPWHNAGITLMNTHATIPTPPYVHLHVTLLVTNASQPNPRYFGRGDQDVVPTSVLTSHEALRAMAKKKKAGKEKPEALQRRAQIPLMPAGKLGWWPGEGKHEPVLEFNSLSYLSKLEPRNASVSSKDEHVVKIFSAAALSDAQLERIMGTGNVLWVRRQEWDAYPELRPTAEFPKLHVDDGLFFLNAFERLISTMETATVSSRNVVAHLLEQELGWDFVHGGANCSDVPSDVQQRAAAAADHDAWSGWGCHSG